MRIFATALMLLSLAAPMHGQAPSPSLPGAVTKPPDWLKADAPFDVDGFFTMPPPGQPDNLLPHSDQKTVKDAVVPSQAVLPGIAVVGNICCLD